MAVLGTIACVSVLPIGCTHTQAGAGTGALVGGIAGAALSGRGKGLQGAAIGAGAGALVGTAIGASEERAERRAAEAYAARALSIPDVISLTQSGTPPNIIINQIRTTGSVYTLTAHDLQVLQQSGVDPTVIQEMQQAGRRVVMPRAPVVIHEPPPVVYVRPAPPPPPVYGVGVMIRR
jgi:uncharacterized protein YcfJ